MKILYYAAAFGQGTLLSFMGYTFSSWQFWTMVVLTAIISMTSERVFKFVKNNYDIVNEELLIEEAQRLGIFPKEEK